MPDELILLTLDRYTTAPGERTAALKFILDENDSSLDHYCDYYELVAVRQGEGFFHWDGCSYPVVSNEVYLIPPGIEHHYSGYTHLSLLHFLFAPEVLAPYLDMFRAQPNFVQLSSLPDQENALVVTDNQMLELDRLVYFIYHETLEKNDGYMLQQELLTLQALNLICRSAFAKSRREMKYSPQLNAAIRFLENNYAEPITLKQLAQCANMSIPVFCRTFKKVKQCSPIRYLLEYRIDIARQLLISSQLPLTEIAEKTGFRDTNYFIRQFSAIVGTPPVSFRKQEHGYLHYPDHEPDDLPRVGDRIFIR